MDLKEEWLAVSVLIDQFIKRLYTVLKQHSVNKCFIKSNTCPSVVNTPIHPCLTVHTLLCICSIPSSALHKQHITYTLVY